MAEAQDPAAVMRIGSFTETWCVASSSWASHGPVTFFDSACEKSVQDWQLHGKKGLMTVKGRRATASELFSNWPQLRAGRRCFVSNLNWRTSWQDLKDKFRECGEVVYANVVKDEDGE